MRQNTSGLAKIAPNRQSGSSNDKNPDIAAIIAQQLQNILPQIVTQVTNNVNNANANGGNGRNGRNGNGGNNGCSYKAFLACNPQDYDGKGVAVALTRWIEKMESVQARDREASIGMSWIDFKALLVEEFCPSNEIEKLESEFWNYTMVGANHAGYTDRFHELAKLVPHLAGILTDEAVCCGTLTRSSEKRKEVEETSKQRGLWKDNKKAKVGKGIVAIAPPKNMNMGAYSKCTKCFTYHPESGACRLCFNCQKPSHFARDCQVPVKQVALVSPVRMENNQRDPNVVMGTFSLNGHFATVHFDSGVDFSFISTKFAPLPNVKPSIVSPGYGKKEEFNRIIHDCKLELENSLFTIDLISLGHGSFEVIMGMDWLSKNKAEIVCREKVVRIPLKGGEVLRVQGERTLGGTKTLMSTKVEEPELSDILIVRNFNDVFPEDLSGLPPQRQVQFRIDLIPGATPVAKSPYRLALLEMQELSEQLQELQDKGFIRLSHSPWGAPVLFVKKKDGSLR
ncbi:putative reverse transcriptase domain-containing protein, partial [Tanacetum coccineum]